MEVISILHLLLDLQIFKLLSIDLLILLRLDLHGFQVDRLISSECTEGSRVGKTGLRKVARVRNHRGAESGDVSRAVLCREEEILHGNHIILDVIV